MGKSYINTDRFGQPYQVVGCKEVEGKDGNTYNKGFVELGGKLYKIEVSAAEKEGVQHWVRVTRVDQKKKHSSM